MEQNKKTEGLGAIIGAIIVIIILLVGAFYFAGQRIEKSKEFQAAIQKQMSTSSDDIDNIASSAASMNLDDLGTGVDGL